MIRNCCYAPSALVGCANSGNHVASFTLVAMATTGERFERAVSIMARLRGPGGCPWDREQTFDTIKPYTLEEAYEVIEAIDARDWPELTGELGDLLLQVLFYSQMAAEEQRFSIDDVLDRLSNKLVDRHPHVFGEVKAETSGEVLRNWQALKAEEKKKRQQDSGDDANAVKAGHPESVLHGISSAMPSLMAAYKISSRAAQVGFDWPNIEALFDKLKEETDELRKNLEEYPEPGPQPVGASSTASARGVKVPEELQARLEDEVGDLLFVLVNVARYLALDPESALRKTNRKFRRRFEYLEDKLREQGCKPADASLDEMESLWQESKQQEKP
jgi:MazG family protein